MTGTRWMSILMCIPLLQFGSATAQENRQCSPEDVRVRLRLSKDAYPQGERVRMRLIAKNTSDQACEMQFPSGRGGTVRVFDDQGLVWEHGYCRVYTAHIEIETWAPDRREVYRFGWNQRRQGTDEEGRIDCEGERTDVEPGSYTAKGIFFGSDPDDRTGKVGFRITG